MADHLVHARAAGLGKRAVVERRGVAAARHRHLVRNAVQLVCGHPWPHRSGARVEHLAALRTTHVSAELTAMRKPREPHQLARGADAGNLLGRVQVHHVLLLALHLLSRPAGGRIVRPVDVLRHRAVRRDGVRPQPARPLVQRPLLAAAFAAVCAKQQLAVLARAVDRLSRRRRGSRLGGLRASRVSADSRAAPSRHAHLGRRIRPRRGSALQQLSGAQRRSRVASRPHQCGSHGDSGGGGEAHREQHHEASVARGALHKRRDTACRGVTRGHAQRLRGERRQRRRLQGSGARARAPGARPRWTPRARARAAA